MHLQIMFDHPGMSSILVVKKLVKNVLSWHSMLGLNFSRFRKFSECWLQKAILLITGKEERHYSVLVVNVFRI